MKLWYVIGPDPSRSKFQSVESYHLSGFDIRSLWRGERIKSKDLSKGMTLNVDGKTPADLLGNPLSLIIMSRRFYDACKPFLAARHCQVLAAPTILKGRELSGYVILNPLVMVPAVQVKKKPLVVSQLTLNVQQLTRNVHMVRVSQCPTWVAVSDVLVDLAQAHRFAGIIAVPVAATNP